MRKVLILVGLALLSLGGCSDPKSNARGVYMLLDTSGTYTQELSKAHAIINYLLGTLTVGDSLAVARIDSGSFSEKDIIHKVTFDSRPSMANEQKRAFKQKIDDFMATVKSSAHTDITGGILQAAEFLNETGAGKKTVLVFSDLEEDLAEGQVRDFPIDVVDIHVVALNVTKLRSDNIDPRDYLKRLDQWRKKVVEGGGEWRVLNDMDNLDKLLEEK